MNVDKETKGLAGPHIMKSGQMYTQEDLDAAMGEAASRAAELTAQKLQSQHQPPQPQYQPPPQPQYQSPPEQRSRRRRRDEDDGNDNDQDEESLMGINPKFVKQLQNTVGVFNALKEFATNPLQKAIENRVGDVAASVVENAFAPRGPPPKRELVDTILNSQFAYGLGAGLGQRGPELLETLSKSFGRQKTEQMIDAMIGKYGKGGERQITESNTPGTISPSSQEKEPPKEQSNVELLLSLDPNNPEHVAAYAESQGGINVETARKMLMIHQDDIIKKMKTQKGEAYPPKQPNPQEQYQQPTQSYQEPSNPVTQVPEQQSQQQNSSPGIEYAEFQEVPKNNTQTNNDQLEVMKTFTEEIGKVMESMVGRIESLSNSVQILQKEIIDVKSSQAYSPNIPNYPPVIPTPPREIIEQPQVVTPPINDIIDRNLAIADMNPFNMEDIYQQPYQQPPQQQFNTAPLDIGSTEEFFERNLEIKTKEQLLKELEEETKIEAAKIKKVEEKKVEEPKIEDIENVEQKDIQKVIEQPKVEQPPQQTEQPPQQTEQPKMVEPKIAEEPKLEQSKENISKIEERPNLEKVDNVTNKIEESKKFVTPIRKDDVHKKFTPSMKKIENKDNN